MKTLTVILTILISVFAIDAKAVNTPWISEQTVIAEQDTTVLFDKFEKGLIFGMESDVEGVIESALFNAVSIKITYPAFSPEDVIDMLNDVAINAQSRKLRYKAYLALAYYKNQDQFDQPENLATMLEMTDRDKIFYYLQEKVQGGLLTSN